MIKLSGVEISEADFEAAYAKHVAKKEKAAKPWPQEGDEILVLQDAGTIAHSVYGNGRHYEFKQGNIFRTAKEIEFERDRRAAEREKRQAENRVLMRLKELDTERGKFVVGKLNWAPCIDEKGNLKIIPWARDRYSSLIFYTLEYRVWEQIISEMPDDVKMMFS